MKPDLQDVIRQTVDNNFGLAAVKMIIVSEWINIIVKLITETDEVYFLKIYRADGEDLSHLENEARICNALIHQILCGAVKPVLTNKKKYAFRLGNLEFGRKCLLFLPALGLPLSNDYLSPHDIGAALACLHRINIHDIGDVRKVSGRHIWLYALWEMRKHSTIFSAILSRFEALHFTLEKEILILDALPRVITHGDLRIENIWVDRGRCIFIDLEDSGLASPVWDFASLIWWNLTVSETVFSLDEFLKGYNTVGSAERNILGFIPLVTLLLELKAFVLLSKFCSPEPDMLKISRRRLEDAFEKFNTNSLMEKSNGA